MQYQRILKSVMSIGLAALLAAPLTAQAADDTPKPLRQEDMQRLPRKGTVMDSASYTDSTGENAVLLTETRVTTRNANDTRYLDKELYAYRFQNTDGQFTQQWRIADFVRECEYDLTAAFIPNSLRVTDLDNNGVNEIWVAYRLGCRSDVSPLNMKIIMYEGTQKYAVRGTERLSTEPSLGGQYTLDEAFTNGPREFRTYAEQMWRKYALHQQAAQ